MSIQVPVPDPAIPPAQATLSMRQSVTKLTAQQLADLRRAFSAAMKITDNRGFSYFAGWHGQPFDWCWHHHPLFLPWHRQYLYYFELALQGLVPGITLPWWDWTVLDGIPPAYTEDSAPGGPNPLLVREVTIYQSASSQPAPPRQPGQAPSVPQLPYDSQWRQAMQATSFLEFSQRVEAIHDDVHVWVGGIMSDITWAAYDPLFYTHHTMIDRAWRIWQHQNPGGVPPPSIIDAKLKPNGMTVRETLDVKALGYDYAGSADSVPGTEPGGVQDGH
jgi:tyrosinase